MKIRREAHLSNCNVNIQSDVQGSIRTGEETYTQSGNSDKTEHFSYRDAAAKIPKINNDNTFSISLLGRTRAATKKLQDEAAAEKEDADYR